MAVDLCERIEEGAVAEAVGGHGTYAALTPQRGVWVKVPGISALYPSFRFIAPLFQKFNCKTQIVRAPLSLPTHLFLTFYNFIFFFIKIPEKKKSNILKIF